MSASMAGLFVPPRYATAMPLSTGVTSCVTSAPSPRRTVKTQSLKRKPEISLLPLGAHDGDEPVW
jgi:hypothetical protein